MFRKALSKPLLLQNSERFVNVRYFLLTVESKCRTEDGYTVILHTQVYLEHWVWAVL